MVQRGELSQAVCRAIGTLFESNVISSSTNITKYNVSKDPPGNPLDGAKRRGGLITGCSVTRTFIGGSGQISLQEN